MKLMFITSSSHKSMLLTNFEQSENDRTFESQAIKLTGRDI